MNVEVHAQTSMRAVRDTDAVIRELAARQHGVVSREQLLSAGMPVHVIDYRVRRARMQPLYAGVYRVGPVAAPREREMAAVLACGRWAVLSHRSAAVLWVVLPPRPGDPVDVSVRRGMRAPGPGVRARRVGDLCDEDITILDGVPVTTPERTLLDLGAVAGERELEQALAAAERRGLVDRARLAARVAACPRRAGSRLLRALLGLDGGPAFVRSEAEERFLALVRRAQLPEPETNVRIHGYEVDFLWRRERLVVEIDGAAFHTSPHAFERDRRRDAILAAHGYRVVRVTWRQLTSEPEALAVRIGQTLAAHR